jgi:hypothetical protein
MAEGEAHGFRVTLVDGLEGGVALQTLKDVNEPFLGEIA